MRAKTPKNIGDDTRLYKEEARGVNAGAADIAVRPEAPDREFRLIGKDTRRIDGRKIVTGAARYTHGI